MIFKKICITDRLPYKGENGILYLIPNKDRQGEEEQIFLFPLAWDSEIEKFIRVEYDREKLNIYEYYKIEYAVNGLPAYGKDNTIYRIYTKYSTVEYLWLDDEDGSRYILIKDEEV